MTINSSRHISPFALDSILLPCHAAYISLENQRKIYAATQGSKPFLKAIGETCLLLLLLLLLQDELATRGEGGEEGEQSSDTTQGNNTSEKKATQMSGMSGQNPDSKHSLQQYEGE